MTKVIDLEKFSSELKDFSEKNIQAYKQAVVESLYEQVPKLVEQSPVDTGLYAQSWRVEANDLFALIGNFAPYAPIIEFGARPFVPPIRPLLEWAKRVLRKPEIDDECWQLAKGVQNKIREHGMEPHHILTNSLEEIVKNIRIKMDGVLK